MIIAVVILYPMRGVDVWAESIRSPDLSDESLKYAEVFKAFQYSKKVNTDDISVPTVVEVAFDDDFLERFDFAVLDTTDNTFEPYYFKRSEFLNQAFVSARTSTSLSTPSNMVDDNTKTFSEFALPEDGQGTAVIALFSNTDITTSAITTLLDNHVALPTSIEIRATVGGQEQIVVGKKAMGGHTVRFPQTTSREWKVTFSYGQPLRISELRLEQENTVKTRSRFVRFLAQPGNLYSIYFNPDRSVRVPTGEAPNLSSNIDVKRVLALSAVKNPLYVIADIDEDGIADVNDNCVNEPNANQVDVNNNGRGDVCDDFDKDGRINSKDNCPNNPNRNQRDEDGDGIGDECDSEESRVTERYKWLPWVGIGFAVVVISVLFGITAHSMRKKHKEGETNEGDKSEHDDSARTV
jgi:hypothetical protein